MSSRETQSILSQLEWDEGLSMPVANAANKSLEDEVQKKQRRVVADTNDMEETTDRVNAMIDHLKNVRQELHGTQGLVTARGKEIETEDHLLKIAQREEGRLKQEILKLEKDVEELKEKKNIYETNIFKQSQKLEEMKSQMNWDQQALEAWLEESARKDEDSMTLQKYTRADDARIKELSLRMQKLTEASMLKRRQLDHEVTETQTCQIELDKTAADFRNAHVERQDLIQQWEYTIEQMQRRDQEMDLLAAHLARVKVEVRKREDIIKEKQNFMDNELNNNREQEKKISMVERQSARVRLDYQEAETQRIQFGDELETLKRTVDRTATDLEATRSQATQLRKECMDKTNRLEQARILRQQLMEKLKKATESTLTAEERTSMMEKLLSGEEVTHETLLTELKLLRELWFRKSNELGEARTAERNLEAEIQGSHAAMRNLRSKVGKLDTDALKQQEIIYNQDFAMQQLERRINRMMGESSDEEKVTLELKVQQLQADLDRKTDMHTQLTTQLKRLSDDIRRLTRELEGSQGQKADLTSKMEGLILYNDCSEKELKKTIGQKQSMMVDENILKLEIKKLQGDLNSKADNVMTLEKRRLQLETAMKERRDEITIHKEMLLAQLKAADEERQQISAELHERISKIDKLKKRYEILMVSMAPPEGEEEKSQAYYVIKAAQEKEEMQREGDDLDARIRKAEREIRALENTLKLMNGRNEQYRKSFNKVTESSDEMEEKQQLEEQMRAVMDKFKYKRRQIRELQDDMQTMGSTYDNLTRDEDAYVEMIESKQARMAQLQKELGEQKGKIERVIKMNSKYSREVRAALKAKEEIPEERDFSVREMREFNKTVMKQVGDAMQQHPDISEAVSMYFAQANLPAPVPGATRVGSSHSSLSSARSSTSSVHSTGSGKRLPSLRLGEDLPPSPAGSTSSMRSVRSQASMRSVRSQASNRSARSQASDRSDRS